MKHFEKQAKLTEKAPYSQREKNKTKHNSLSKKITSLNAKATKPHYRGEGIHTVVSFHV